MLHGAGPLWLTELPRSPLLSSCRFLETSSDYVAFFFLAGREFFEIEKLEEPTS